jgi:tRNA modification GTPase
VRRALEQIRRADHALWVFDGERDPNADGLDEQVLPAGLPLTRIRNKADLCGVPPGQRTVDGHLEICLSAKTGEGLELLRDHLRRLGGLTGGGEGDFSARQRHLDAIERARLALMTGRRVLLEQRAGELLAEELRLAQMALSSITGEFSADDLLGEIFSSFCIGK